MYPWGWFDSSKSRRTLEVLHIPKGFTGLTFCQYWLRKHILLRTSRFHTKRLDANTAEPTRPNVFVHVCMGRTVIFHGQKQILFIILLCFLFRVETTLTTELQALCFHHWIVFIHFLLLFHLCPLIIFLHLIFLHLIFLHLTLLHLTLLHLILFLLFICTLFRIGLGGGLVEGFLQCIDVKSSSFTGLVILWKPLLKPDKLIIWCYKIYKRKPCFKCVILKILTQYHLRVKDSIRNC
ncbi:hypothetical protein EYF80_003099 [Liparis tanakae]|uniref:Uncharacterized protein n=1 Tax=Liparis tanakae TaxID=230148 RepID=A0A4Z2J9N7_9TELE|nr:hypothetical protein EYF80_003099 [Liparis tanakae]